jgi:hypothetical protein
MKFVSSRFSTISFFIFIALALIIVGTGCGKDKKSSSSAEPPKERTYGVEDPNGPYLDLSSEERYQLLFDNLSSATDGTVVPLQLDGGYEVVHAYIEHDLNIHTNSNAKVTGVILELGKPTDDHAYHPELTIEKMIKDYNNNNRSKWLYGPYESVVDTMKLKIKYDDPFLNRHLDTLSYNHPIEISTVLDDKPVLKFPQRDVAKSTEYIVYEWPAMGEHRYSLSIVKGSEAEKDFDVETFILSTFNQ